MIREVTYGRRENENSLIQQSLYIRGSVYDNCYPANDSFFSIDLSVEGKNYDSDFLLLIKSNILGAKSFLDLESNYIVRYNKIGSQEEIFLRKGSLELEINCELYTSSCEIAKCLGVIVSNMNKNDSLFIAKNEFNEKE